MTLKKRNINRFFIITLFLLFFTGLGCGRKAPPTVSQKVMIKPVSDITISFEKEGVFIFWKYEYDADYFEIEIAGMECKTCAPNYKKIGTIEGSKRFFEIYGYNKGYYKVRMVAVKGLDKNNSASKDFYIK